MAQHLSDYVQQLQRSGYSTQAIRAHLSRSGYSTDAINQAFSGLNIHKNKPLFVFGSLFVLIVLLVISYFVFLQPSTEISLKIHIPTKTGFFPGESILFEKTISSSKPKTSVDVLYEVLSITGEIVAQKSEKLLISDVSKSQSIVVIPKNIIPGDYKLVVTVKHTTKSLSDSFSFNVMNQERVNKEEQNATLSTKTSSELSSVICAEGCISLNRCMNGICVAGKCEFTPIIPCCGDGKCDNDEDTISCPADCGVRHEPKESVVLSATSVASREPDKAIILCNSLVEDSSVDDCLDTIAKESKNSAFCVSMRISDARDSCFMRFALNGDFSVCSKIENRYLSNSCDYLSQSSNLS